MTPSLAPSLLLIRSSAVEKAHGKQILPPYLPPSLPPSLPPCLTLDMPDQLIRREGTDGHQVLISHVNGGYAVRVCVIGTDGGSLLFFSSAVGCREGKGGGGGRVGGREKGVSERGI